MSTLTLMYGCAWTLTSPHWQSHLNHIETTRSMSTPQGRAQLGFTSNNVQDYLDASECQPIVQRMHVNEVLQQNASSTDT